MHLPEKTTQSDFRLRRRTAVCNRAQRVASELATTGCVSPLSFAYNPLGALTAIAYPSGRTVNTWYDAAGRICILGGLSCTAAKAYAGSTAYAENGALAQDTLRNGLVEATTFNSRFQPTALTATTGSQLLKLTNNGNVVSETVLTSGGLNATQSFTYDAYNRLLLAVENPANPANSICPDIASAWCQSFAYDQFGNRAVTAYGPQVAFFLNPNWTPSSLTQFSAGNQWTRGNLASLGSNSSPGTVASVFSYDGESRMTGSNVANTGGVQYVYDGSGRRVAKIAGGTTTIYVYDAQGLLAAEYSNVANPVEGTEYLTADPLGSTRLVTNAAGAVVKRYDYVPFGEEVSAGVGARATADGYGSGTYPNAPDVVSEKFTGKERDSESGLDYFGAGYYASALGRLISPDPEQASASLFNPQLWNGYSYSLNNPLAYKNPDGRNPLLVTAAVGAGVGALVGGGFELLNQYSRNGGSLDDLNWSKVGTAALGGGVAGGIAGLTLGLGTAAGITLGVGETVAANAGANVIGGEVQRQADAALGNGAAPTGLNEAAAVTIDAVAGGVGGLVGGRIADEAFPLPNVRKEIEILKFANRRSTRAAQIQFFNKAVDRQAALNGAVSGVQGGARTSVWTWWSQLLWGAANQSKKEPKACVSASDSASGSTFGGCN